MPVVLARAHQRFFIGALATALLAGAYFFFTFMALRFGMQGAIPPVVAGWGPTVVFGATAAAVYDLIPS